MIFFSIYYKFRFFLVENYFYILRKQILSECIIHFDFGKFIEYFFFLELFDLLFRDRLIACLESWQMTDFSSSQVWLRSNLLMGGAKLFLKIDWMIFLEPLLERYQLMFVSYIILYEIKENSNF